jgi:hypothetical protein
MSINLYFVSSYLKLAAIGPCRHRVFNAVQNKTIAPVADFASRTQRMLPILRVKIILPMHTHEEQAAKQGRKKNQSSWIGFFTTLKLTIKALYIQRNV